MSYFCQMLFKNSMSSELTYLLPFLPLPNILPLITPPTSTSTTGPFSHLQFPCSVKEGRGDDCLLLTVGLCCLEAQRRLGQQAKHMECIKFCPAFSLSFWFHSSLKPQTPVKTNSAWMLAHQYCVSVFILSLPGPTMMLPD